VISQAEGQGAGIARHGDREAFMIHRAGIGAAVLAATLVVMVASAPAVAQSKYPDLKGQWTRLAKVRVTGQPSFDQTKPWGSGQQAPLMPEYQAILDANLKDQQNGGHGGFTGWTCLPYGMPMMMYAFTPVEFVVTPETTYVLVNQQDAMRRIYTDGRTMPPNAEPSFAGYSIGHWIDEAGDGKYSALEVETRYLRGPRAYDVTGIPFHADDQTVIRERFYLDKADRNTIYDQITVIDDALTRPYSKLQKAVRNTDPRPVWLSEDCPLDNVWVKIGKDAYVRNTADGELMPSMKDQPPPDLRYFNRAPK
jgi:hypothetical protein